MGEGNAEGKRVASVKLTPKARLSGGVCGIRGQTLIINVPGSPKAVRENLEVVLRDFDDGLASLTGRAGECAR